MQSVPLHLLPAIPKLTITTAVDILVVAILIYQFLMIVRGRRAAHILTGVFILVLIYVGATLLGLELLRSSLATLAPYTAFALIVMFQSEIRRMLARIGRRRWAGFGSRVKTREFADDILLAMAQLSLTKTGALIVVERDIGLRTFVESGVMLDAMLSRDLLLAIFQKDGSLHDGAVIVQGDRVTAAGCFLPLSMNPLLMGKHGTRHRAGIGVTEEGDCLALVVSEETGKMSVAAFGEIEQDLTIDQVRERLNRHFGMRRHEGKGVARGETVPASARSLPEGQ
jgi:diadenylate cyclase